MNGILIKNAVIINEGESKHGSILIRGEKIEKVVSGDCPSWIEDEATKIIDASGLWMIPGCIDDQVHFREPGLTHKGDISSESHAAVSGGVTSYMEMPNTKPQTVTLDALKWKYDRAAEVSLANYAFYLGATNDNTDELRRADFSKICGVKVFMGSSTGNMLVDNMETLSRIFAEVPAIIAVHAEKEEIIKQNTEYYTGRFGKDLPITFHPLIRSVEACYASSSKAVELATRYNARLHILHLSTAKELSLLEDKQLKDKRITAEACVHHLYFDDNNYAEYGNMIKWNPAIKTYADREALLNAVNGNLIDIVATDHAPHLLSEKQGSCLHAASGGPLLQHSLLAMMELATKGHFTIEKAVEKLSHAPATLFSIKERGYIREGYYADIVLINPQKSHTVTKENIVSKCGWSPFTGHKFPCTVEMTFVNGTIVYDNGKFNEDFRGSAILFDR
ncbi:MAG: dihydroorotase [Bacteroidales bacterium]